MNHQEEDPYVFGIHLGTTIGCVAVVHDKGKPELGSISGKYTMLLIVTFARYSFQVSRGALIHEDMKQPHQTIRCVNRLIGRSCAEIAKKTIRMI